MSLAAQTTSAFVNGVDAVRQNGDVFFGGPDIRHFSVAHQQKAGQIAGNLSKEQSQKLFPCEVEKLSVYAITVFRSGLSC